MLCDDLEGWDGGNGRQSEEGEDVCRLMTDSHPCTAETITNIVKQLSSN